MTNAQYGEDLTFQRHVVEILTRAQHKAFTYLCQWERQLTFAANQDNALASVRDRVDGLLAGQAPDVLDRFNVAYRRLREAAGNDSDAEADEELSQAVASCRRILKAVVDVVQPPTHLDPYQKTATSSPMSTKEIFYLSF